MHQPTFFILFTSVIKQSASEEHPNEEVPELILQIKCLPKKYPKFLLSIVKNDVRSTTGFSLRKIMLLLNKKHIDNIKIIDLNDYIYAPVTRNDVWKVELVKKLIEV